MPRDPQRIRRHALTALTLGTTLPVLALLCLGRSPSSYDTDNLPRWERHAPGPAPVLGNLKNNPLPASYIDVSTLPVFADLLSADENEMFRNLKVVDRLPQDRLSAGNPGVWLESAAVLGRANPEMSAKLDRVAARLMDAQNSNGYLGPVAHVHAYTAADIAAHCNNMRGLLAYYSVTRRPAAIYAAMRAGDFLLSNYDPWPGFEQPGAEDSFVFAMTRLYQATGDVDYLRFAEREEATRGCDGLGLCALYEATGNRRYLREALRTWKVQNDSPLVLSPCELSARNGPSPEFGAELFAITNDEGCLQMLRDCRATSVWPVYVAYTSGATGLSVNVLYPAAIRFGSLQVEFGVTARVRPRAVSLPASAGPASQGAVVEECSSLSLAASAAGPRPLHITFQPGCLPADTAAASIQIDGKTFDIAAGTTQMVVQPTPSQPGRPKSDAAAIASLRSS